MSFLSDLRAPYATCEAVKINNASGAAYASGDVVVKNNIVGIIYEDTADGDDGTLVARVPFPGVRVTKAAAEAWAVGQNIYWNVANSNFTTADVTNTVANTLAGKVAEDATSAATVGLIALNF